MAVCRPCLRVRGHALLCVFSYDPVYSFTVTNRLEIKMFTLKRPAGGRTSFSYVCLMAPDRSERHYVIASRVATLIVMLLSVCAALDDSVGDAWKYLFNLTAGVGLVMILRWYWWRVNAWSEIAALVDLGARLERDHSRPRVPDSDPNAQAETLLVTVPVTTSSGSRSRSSRRPRPDRP